MRGVAKFLLGGALGALLGILISRRQTQKTPKDTRPVAPMSEVPSAAPTVTSSIVAEPISREALEEYPEPVESPAPTQFAPLAEAEVGEPLWMTEARVTEEAEPAVAVTAPQAEVVEAVMPEEAEPVMPPEAELAEPVMEPVAAEVPAAPESTEVVAAEAMSHMEVPETVAGPEVVAVLEAVAAAETISAPEPEAPEAIAEAEPQVAEAIAEAEPQVAEVPWFVEAETAAAVTPAEAQPVEPAAPFEVVAAEEPAVEEAAVVPEAPVAGEAVAEPETVAALEAMVEIPQGYAATADLRAESEVVVSPELLEKPLPGVGWEPSEKLAANEEALEEFLTLIPEDIFPAASTVAAGEPEAVAESPGPGAAVSESGELALAKAPTPETTSVLRPSRRQISPEDLKARIEETRRRIRKELEEPFLLGGPEKAEGEETGTAPVPEPVIGEALSTGPIVQSEREPVESAAPAVDEETRAGGIPPQSDLRVAGSDSPPSEAAPPWEAEAVPTDGLGVDYEAMRNRIETTRNRLKAKAFDAMMSGESSLLGRDSGEVPVELPTGATVNTEISQTIDATLREEET